MHRECVFLTSEARLIGVGTELRSIQTPNERNVTISSASLKRGIKSKHRLWTPVATGHFQTFVFFKYIKHSARGLLLIMICGLLSINNRPQLVLEKQNTSQWCNVWKQKQCECVPPHNKDVFFCFFFIFHSTSSSVTKDCPLRGNLRRCDVRLVHATPL